MRYLVCLVILAAACATVACQQEDIFGEAALTLSSLRASAAGTSCSTCSSSSSQSPSSMSQESSSSQGGTSSGGTGGSSAGPIILGHTPAANASSQPTTGSIIINFDEAVVQSMLNPSTVTLLAAGVQQAVSMSAQVVFDSFLNKNVCRLTISYSSLPRGVTCTVSLSDAIKTSDGRMLSGGYTFTFSTVASPTFTGYTPGQSSVVTPASYVTLTASENINYSGAVVTVGGTAMSAATTVGSSDLSVTGNVLKIRMPDACFAWSDAGSGSLKTVQVSVSGVTAALDGAILPDTVLDYNLERAWHEDGSFAAAAPVLGGKSRTIQLAVTTTHLYLAYFASSSVHLQRYDLSAGTWGATIGSWSCANGVFALTSNGTQAYLVRAYDGGQIFLHDGSGYIINSHTPVSGVVPTSLDAVASGNMIWYLFNSAQAGANYLHAWLYDISASSFNQAKNLSPSTQSHDYPSIALDGGAPLLLYAEGSSIRMWDIAGAAGYGPWTGFFNGVFKLMYVGATEVLLFDTGISPVLKVSKTRPFSSQVSLYRMPDSAQADACVMDGTTPVFMYPVDPVGTSSLVCDGWYGGMSDMRPLATQSPDVSAHRADWSVVATGVSLGARPAIVATPDAVFAAWYDSTQNKVFVRRHDGR